MRSGPDDSPLDAAAIPWDDAVTSGRDRSPAARIARAIETGDALEPACPHVAAVNAWLDRGDDGGDVREVLEDVAALDALTYDELRGRVAKRAGIRATTLDAERERMRPAGAGTEDGAQQGSALVLAIPERWPHAVDGAELLAGLARAITRYVALPEGAATAVAVWVLHAHAHEAAHVSPLLAPASPEKRCGKTTLLHVLTRLVPCPVPAANISPAALYRCVERYRPTLLIDEADTIFGAGGDDRCAELRGLLNSGHNRASACVVRCVEPDYEPRAFTTWCAKVIALIGHLPDTLTDRSIVIPMRRRSAGEYVERLRLDRLDELEPLLRMAARWAHDHLEPLRCADPEVPAGLHDRAADNWRPLLAIADRAGGDWPDRARRAAELLSGGSDCDDGSVRTLLLRDLRAVMGDAERMASADIVAELVAMEHRPWPEWRRGNPLTARSMARLLEPFGARPRQLWIAGAKTRGYERADLVDAWGRYLPGDDDAPQPDPRAPSGRTGRSPAGTGIAPNRQAVGTENPTGSEIGGNPHQHSILPDIPDGNPPTGRRTPKVKL